MDHKQTYALQNGTSALPPKAEMCDALVDICFGPIADINRRYPKQNGELLWKRSTVISIDISFVYQPPALMFGGCFISNRGTGLFGFCKSGLQSCEAPPGRLLMLGKSTIDLLNSITTG